MTVPPTWIENHERIASLWPALKRLAPDEAKEMAAEFRRHLGPRDQRLVDEAISRVYREQSHRRLPSLSWLLDAVQDLERDRRTHATAAPAAAPAVAPSRAEMLEHLAVLPEELIRVHVVNVTVGIGAPRMPTLVKRSDPPAWEDDLVEAVWRASARHRQELAERRAQHAARGSELSAACMEAQA